MAGVADASAEEDRPEHGFRKHAGDAIGRELALVCRAVHFCGLERTDGVDFLSEKWRQREQIAQISRPEQVVLIAIQFILAVRAEFLRAAQEKLRQPRVGPAKRRAAIARDKERSRSRYRLKKTQARFHDREALQRAGTRVVPAESGFRAH